MKELTRPGGADGRTLRPGATFGYPAGNQPRAPGSRAAAAGEGQARSRPNGAGGKEAHR